jgi:hypothetical protein
VDLAWDADLIIGVDTHLDTLYRFKTHRRVSDLRIHEISFAVSRPQGLRPRVRAGLIVHPTWYPT